MSTPEHPPAPLDETRAHMEEVARRARGEAPAPLRLADPSLAARRIGELRALTARATDDRPGAAGKAARLARRTTWLARDAHSRAHLELTSVLEELETRLAAAEAAIAAHAATEADLRSELARLAARTEGTGRP